MDVVAGIVVVVAGIVVAGIVTVTVVVTVAEPPN